jgi:hypothetical protein
MLLVLHHGSDIFIFYLKKTWAYFFNVVSEVDDISSTLIFFLKKELDDVSPNFSSI